MVSKDRVKKDLKKFNQELDKFVGEVDFSDLDYSSLKVEDKDDFSESSKEQYMFLLSENIKDMRNELNYIKKNLSADVSASVTDAIGQMRKEFFYEMRGLLQQVYDYLSSFDKDSIEYLRGEVNSLSEKQSKVESKVVEFGSEFSKSLGDMSSQTNEQVNKITSNVDKGRDILSKRLEQIENKLANMEEHLGVVDTLKKEVDSLPNQIKKLPAEIEKDLEGEYNKFFKQQEALSKRIGGLESEMSGIKSSIGSVDELLTKVENIPSQVEKDIEGEYSKLENKQNAFLERLDVLEKSITDVHNEVKSIEELQSQINLNSSDKSYFDDLVNRLNSLESAFEDIKGSIGSYEGVYDRLEKIVEGLKTGGSSKEYRDLVGNQANLVNKISYLDGSLKDLKKDISDLKSNGVSSSSDVEKSNKIAELENKLEGLGSSVSNVENLIKNMSSSSSKQGKEVDKSSKEYNELLNQQSDLVNRVSGLDSSLKELREDINRVKNDGSKGSEQNSSDKSDKVAQLEKKLTNLEDSISNFEGVVKDKASSNILEGTSRNEVSNSNSVENTDSFVNDVPDSELNLSYASDDGDIEKDLGEELTKGSSGEIKNNNELVDNSVEIEKDGSSKGGLGLKFKSFFKKDHDKESGDVEDLEGSMVGGENPQRKGIGGESEGADLSAPDSFVHEDLDSSVTVPNESSSVSLKRDSSGNELVEKILSIDEKLKNLDSYR